MDEIKLIIEVISRVMEAVGVVLIAIGGILALLKYVIATLKNVEDAYSKLRQQLGKAILLGLEVLVAADIINTVVTEPTLEKVFTLGVIVLIRTFLSLSLQVEIEGKFPWQTKKSSE